MGAVGIVLSVVFVVLLAVFISWPPPKLSQRLLAWKMKGQTFKFNNHQIFYVDEIGAGDFGTLFCLHGFPTFSYDWTKILPELKKDFSRIVMVDFLGYGFSDKPQGHIYTIAEQADIIEGLSTNLNIPAAHVLSHDYGDTVALELLSRFNKRTAKLEMKSLVMLNGGVFPETHYPRISQKILLMPGIGYAASHLFSYDIFSRGFSEVFGSDKPTSEDLEDFWAALRYNNGDRSFCRVINFLNERSRYRDKWVGALQNSKVKVHMIYGPADPVNPPAFAKHFLKMVPKQSIRSLNSDVGHYPQWENPVDVISEIRNFMANNKK